jgi:tRNA(fMet)-specific endonuclease VapC
VKYLLDSNVLLHLANRVTGFRRIVKRIDRLDAPEDVAISAITAHEVHYQLLKAKVSKERLAALAYYLAQFKALPFNARAAREAAAVRVYLESSGCGIGFADSLIAGHAKALDLVCVTDNVSEFDRVPGLHVENWLRP